MHMPLSDPSVLMTRDWRAQALTQSTANPGVLGRLSSTYPVWPEVVESLVDADQKRPIRR
jgi:hypothetical protein